MFGIDGTKNDYKRLNFDSQVCIYQIRIDKSAKTEILKQLSLCGIDKMTMFPDMQNACEAYERNMNS